MTFRSIHWPHFLLCHINSYNREASYCSRAHVASSAKKPAIYIRQFSVWFFRHKASQRFLKISSLQYRVAVSSFFYGNLWWLRVEPANAPFSTEKMRLQSNLEYKDFFQLMLELSTGAQLHVRYVQWSPWRKISNLLNRLQYLHNQPLYQHTLFVGKCKFFRRSGVICHRLQEQTQQERSIAIAEPLCYNRATVL